jgi:antitoxin (DNA-binding transcriptional repressor) of toxin-antitoxin stability system
MTTLSRTQARINLSSLLKRAAKGEDIGILHGGQVIALRPVKVHSDDYALREYDVTEEERRSCKRLGRTPSRTATC